MAKNTGNWAVVSEELENDELCEQLVPLLETWRDLPIEDRKQLGVPAFVDRYAAKGLSARQRNALVEVVRVMDLFSHAGKGNAHVGETGRTE
jgi:hypothetical protein